MSLYAIKDISKSTDRYKLYILQCNPETLSESIAFVQSQGVPSLNIGREVAAFIDKSENYKYLNIEVYDFIKWILDLHRAKEDGSVSKAIAVYNLGILLEPVLELNANQLLKEYSKSAGLIIVWENQFDQTSRLFWETQSNKYFFDFNDAPLKKLQYAI
ncbi:MAG: hypothetical protein NTU44_15355 [Bacteroidetes bacterium]|nr:hypothetical protein [Bacteroidota bacterium]